MFLISDLKRNTERLVSRMAGACKEGLAHIHIPLVESNRQILVILTNHGFIPNKWYSFGPFTASGELAEIRVFFTYVKGQSYISHFEYVGLDVPFEDFRDDPDYQDVLIVFIRRVGIVTRSQALEIGADVFALIEICHL